MIVAHKFDMEIQSTSFKQDWMARETESSVNWKRNRQKVEEKGAIRSGVGIVYRGFVDPSHLIRTNP